jgi:hypothetical protein
LKPLRERWQRSTRARAGFAGWPATATVGLVATVLTWRWQAWPPVHAGLSSWQAGLALAFVHHFQWGPQVVFTFGPYGFLEDVEPFGRLTAGLALAYGFTLRYSVACLVVSALRRSFPLWLAGAGAWLAVGVAANLAEAPALATVTALAMAMRALGASSKGQKASRSARVVLLASLGGLAGLQLLVEVTSGVVCAGLALVAAVFAQNRRRLHDAALTLAALAAVAVVALVAAGQSLANVPSYFRGSLAVVAGYTPAMSLSTGRVAEDFFGLLDLALLASLAIWALLGRGWQQSLGVSLCLAGWTWELAKEGYVRHDVHDLTFLGLVTAALALVSARAEPSSSARTAAGQPPEPAPRPWLARGVRLGAVAVAACLACAANGGPPLSLVSPAESARSLAVQVLDLASAQRWAVVQTLAKRQAARTGDALPGRLLNALATHSFAVEPVEDSMSFAYPALRHWDPEPVLQAYSAYTSYLDHLDAAFLASQRAPQLILYRPVSTNRFDPAWQPPAATEALYCHYVEVMTADYWVLLRRVPDRCGRAVAIEQVTAHFGQRVDVPAAPGPGDMVIARFSLGLPAGTGAENFFWKAPALHVETWVANAPSSVASPSRAFSAWRFVAATASDDHVLYAPPALGWTAGYGPQPVEQFEFAGGGWPKGEGTVKVSFLSVPLRRQPA